MPTLVMLALVGSAPAAVRAAPLAPRSALVRVITAQQEQPAWFTTAFLSQVGRVWVQQEVEQFRAAPGHYETIVPQPNASYFVRYQRGWCGRSSASMPGGASVG